MASRPLFIVIVLATAGASLLLHAGPDAISGRYTPATMGALVAAIATARLLRALRPRDRASISIGVFVLGFFAGAASGVGPFPSSLAFAGAFLPAFALFLAGVGRERAAFELSEIEEKIDDASTRAASIARAIEIRDDARKAARALDPEARGEPEHAGDPRAVFAYAAQVAAYGRALDRAFDAAVEALAEVPVRWMPASMRPLMIGNLAFFQVAARAPEAALATLDRLPTKDAAPEHRAALRAARALALVHVERLDEARALVGSSDEEAQPPDRLKARYAIVRAFLERDEARVRSMLAKAAERAEGRAELVKMKPAAPARFATTVSEVLSPRED